MSARAGTTSVLEVWRGADRFVTRTEETTTAHSFSFGTHYHPDNVGWGPLVAHNDERVAPGPGYEPHRHAATEIVTWVLSGTLQHEDSTGRRTLLYPGTVQRQSAGTGLQHAERNAADAADGGADVHFVQMWLRPDHPERTPAYACADVPRGELDRGWVAIVAGGGRPALLGLDCHATLWATRVRPGERRTWPNGSFGHGFVTSGSVQIDGLGSLLTGDAVRYRGSHPGNMVGATDSAELLVWEFAS